MVTSNLILNENVYGISHPNRTKKFLENLQVNRKCLCIPMVIYMKLHWWPQGLWTKMAMLCHPYFFLQGLRVGATCYIIIIEIVKPWIMGMAVYIPVGHCFFLHDISVVTGQQFSQSYNSQYMTTELFWFESHGLLYSEHFQKRGHSLVPYCQGVI